MNKIREKMAMEKEAQILAFKPLREKKSERICNLCKSPYIAQTKYDRFCNDCKEHSELYHYYEWLPAC